MTKNRQNLTTLNGVYTTIIYTQSYEKPFVQKHGRLFTTLIIQI